MSTASSFVRVYDGNPTEDGKFAGTAFFITPQKLLTAKHVVQGCESGVFLHGLPDGSSPQLTAHDIAYCDNDRDVALLHTAAPFDVFPILPATTPPQTGQAITLHGFFDASQALHTRSTIVSGHVGVQASWQIPDGVKKGMSGGAVLREGELLGVIYARDEKEQIISYFVPIDVIIAWLGDSVSGFNDFAIPATDTAEQQRAIKVFVGRHDELTTLRKTLLGDNQTPVAITALQGMAGVGKSWLADHFHATHRAHFPGGYLRLTLNAEHPASTDLLLAELAERCELSAPQHSLAKHLRQRLISPKTLVHIENLDGDAAVQSATQLCNQLPDCAVVLSGRETNFGKARQWPQVSLKPFQQHEALEQLNEEMKWLGAETLELSEAQELIKVLGGLPLAIHIAAGYLDKGFSVADFLEELKLTGYDLPPADASDGLLNRDAARAVLHSTFTISLNLLAQLSAKRRIESGDTVFHSLGVAPLSGFGFSIAQALLGVEPPQCRSLLRLAQDLSLIDTIQQQPQRWQVHPLLADYLRQHTTDINTAKERLNQWFLTRLPEPEHNEEQETENRHGWHELNEQSLALAEWLGNVPDEIQIDVESSGSKYAVRNGPFAHWMVFCQRALNNPAHNEQQRSNILFTLMEVAQSSGNMMQAMEYAERKYQLDIDRDEPREAALAKGKIADILQARGQLDEAMRIRNEEQLPVYESLGEVREIAITKGKIADILLEKGDVEASTELHENEVLPILESLGDKRGLLVRQTNLAMAYIQTEKQQKRAKQLLCMALQSAEEMQIPEAAQIKEILEGQGWSCD